MKELHETWNGISVGDYKLHLTSLNIIMSFSV